MLHGTSDTDVPYMQSQQMAAALAENGIPHRLLILPGFGHAFDRNMNDPQVKEAFNAVIVFLQEYLTL
ncbi:MAG TPA: prolyl oligopeptidase family serine peptidase [Firmicutes bacterium]|nr:prolyl oligopeptidase family serine peptidase [Bacillota bacterium]